MNKRNLIVGTFLIAATALAASGLFLIGERHRAFDRHLNLYAKFANVDGIAKGTKVRVSGMDAGQLTHVDMPDRPSSRFRLQLQVDERLHGLIRTDSLVTIETDGLVGDKFLLIHAGTDNAAPAPKDAVLATNEPFELAEMMNKANGLMTQLGGTVKDVQIRADSTLDALTATLQNANGLITTTRTGHGTVGMLLTDDRASAQVKQALASTQTATDKLNQASAHLNDVLVDVQSRDLGAQAQQTMQNAQDATVQLNQLSHQVNQKFTAALGEDQFGVDAATNLRTSLSNVNRSTANLADDSEALKHNFLFRGFFKRRGYYSLDQMSPGQYRQSVVASSSSSHREWLDASNLFERTGDGEVLSSAGKLALDRLVGQLGDSAIGQPMVIEGYASALPPDQELVVSRRRAVLVRQYLESRFQLQQSDLGVVPLRDLPPASSGKTSWDGVCVLTLAHKNKG